jgi:hypothetical protein
MIKFKYKKGLEIWDNAATPVIVKMRNGNRVLVREESAQLHKKIQDMS